MAIVIGNDQQLGTLGDYDDETGGYNNAFALFGVPKHRLDPEDAAADQLPADSDDDAEAGQLGELGLFSGVSHTTLIVGGLAAAVGGYFLAKKLGYI